MTKKMKPIHPGEILLEEFLKPMAISQYRVAATIRVSPRRINEIVQGKRSITADTALRLSRCFGTSERFWLNLQARHDLDIEKDRIEKELATIHSLGMKSELDSASVVGQPGAMNRTPTNAASPRDRDHPKVTKKHPKHL